MMRLSVVIITRNEEANLGRCIESVKFADEIIVVDSHSEDRTVEIAGQLGAKVFTVDWTGYGPAKQYAAIQASGDWILSIDADEALSPNLADEIRGIVESSPPINGYDMPRLTNFLGRWIHHCGWYPDRVLRLFRRGRGRFTNATVHEALIVDGPIGHCLGNLHHFSYPTLELYFEKFNRYTTMGAEQAFGRGERTSLFDLTFRPAAAFVKHYISKAGFLDGVEGLIISILSS